MAIINTRSQNENSKAAKAKAIYEAMLADDNQYSRKDVLARFKAEAGLTDAGAATYYYNLTKKPKEVK